MSFVIQGNDSAALTRNALDCQVGAVRPEFLVLQYQELRTFRWFGMHLGCERAPVSARSQAFGDNPKCYAFTTRVARA